MHLETSIKRLQATSCLHTWETSNIKHAIRLTKMQIRIRDGKTRTHSNRRNQVRHS